MSEVCVVGSINVDLMARVERLPAPGETVLGETVGRFAGGKGLNQAIAARRCGAGTRFCGAVGDDAEGMFLVGIAERAGVDTTHVAALTGHRTGTAHVFVLPGSENSIVVLPGANAGLSAHAAGAAVEGARVVLVQLEVPAVVARSALEAGRRGGATTILNAAPAAPDADGLLGQVDILVVNESEVATLGGAARCLQLGAGSVVVTLGARGCELHRGGHGPESFDAVTVAAVDSTGAGDAFCGALAAAVAGGADLPAAIRQAAAAGAITVGSVGAQTGRLTTEAIAGLLARES
ncbi:ribokinase [Nocardioides astragali]|uniref:Ribokinase n=1 Tax=Nocardioides astragali TaxID=1776736 RepID=A0ABW2N061_9ACTN|nr:ribokinase [Nocardioides astragali]